MIGAAGASNREDRAPQWRLWIFVAWTLAMALGITVLTLRVTPVPGGPTLVVLCAAALVSERFKLAISEDSPVAMSLTLAVMMAAIVIDGAQGAIAVGICAVLGGAMLQSVHPPVIKTLFNTGLFAAAAGVAGLAYQLAGGSPGHQGTIGPQQMVAWSAALVAYAAINWPFLLVIIHLSTRRSLRNIWRQDFRWTPVQVAVSGAIGFTLGTAYIAFSWVGAVIYLLPLLAVRAGMRLYTSQMHEQIDILRRAQEDVAATNEGLVKTLASVIDARDIYLYGHSVQAARYAREVAIRMELPAEEVRNAEYGALLHDIGKIGISEAILNKPARLTEEEYLEIQEHCEIGYRLLSELPSFESIAQVVYSHHERFDGAGYPRRLAGDDIPIAARIVSVVEATEAMVSDRPYRKGMSPDEVLRELAEGAGTQWDADVVAAFSHILSTDRTHLQMRNSALDVVLKQPLSRLSSGARGDANASFDSISASFQEAAQPIFILDEEYHFVSLNPAAQRLTGWMEAQVQGREWWGMCAGGKPAGALATLVGATRELGLRRRDGSFVQLEVTGSPLQTNSALYWLIIGHDVSHRVRRETDLARQAATDHLTRLDNRKSFELKAKAAMASSTLPFSVALVDLNGLKRINDAHGHAEGDEAIRKLADCLAASIREEDVAARLGGDEFVLLVKGARESSVELLLGRAAEMARRASTDKASITFSAGVAEWDGTESFEHLMRRADARMYANKTASGDSRIVSLPRR
ncbi:MAG: HD domain-containing phosphohydrolase [Candidatus Dormibacteria bacterium]